MEREAVERAELERDAVDRDPVEREPLRDVPDELERVVRDEPPEAFVLVSAARSLSKSFSACLFVFEALRRSAVSAAVTSL